LDTSRSINWFFSLASYFLRTNTRFCLINSCLHLKRQCQPQCICLHFTLKVMECQQITIINISLVLCRYNSVKMRKYNHRMVEIYDGLKTKTWITLPMLLFEHCLSAQCIVVDIVPLILIWCNFSPFVLSVAIYSV
jgi:hypothetical protein